MSLRGRSNAPSASAGSIVYTAGTEHSRVELPGLDHATALSLRDHLLPRGSDDAV